MKAKPLVILGSARSEGETKRAVRLAFPDDAADVIDLKQLAISPYDYQYNNQDDDFLLIATRIVSCETIVFATPVYWYAMSAEMKTFFDRLSDLITVKKEMGRALKGKCCYLIATGTDETLPQGFEIPFQKTCEYFEMQFIKSAYLYTGEDVNLRTTTQVKVVALGMEIIQ